MSVQATKAHVYNPESISLLEALPEEIFCNVTSYLPMTSLYALMGTNKKNLQLSFEYNVNRVLVKAIDEKKLSLDHKIAVLVRSMSICKGVNYHYAHSESIGLAATANHAALLEYILKQDNSYIKPSASNNKALYQACKRRSVEAARLLLADTRFKLKKWNPLIYCAKNGRKEILALLLKDERFEPSIFFNRAIRMASLKGRTECVKLLVKERRVNPFDRNYEALHNATCLGHQKVVEILLEYGHIESRAIKEAIEHSLRNKQFEISKILFQSKMLCTSHRVQVLIEHVDVMTRERIFCQSDYYSSFILAYNLITYPQSSGVVIQLINSRKFHKIELQKFVERSCDCGNVKIFVYLHKLNWKRLFFRPHYNKISLESMQEYHLKILKLLINDQRLKNELKEGSITFRILCHGNPSVIEFVLSLSGLEMDRLQPIHLEYLLYKWEHKVEDTLIYKLLKMNLNQDTKDKVIGYLAANRPKIFRQLVKEGMFTKVALIQESYRLMNESKNVLALFIVGSLEGIENTL